MAITTGKYKKTWKIIKIIFYVSVPLILIALPTDFFDAGKSVCLSKSIFDIECYACGITKATMHLIHFDFQEAWAYNKLVFIVFPLISIMWLKLFLKEWGILILKWL